ncbi:MAG TPA: ribosome biogenesis GTPase Der, partial [Thermoanaerobaculia bacterium]|nr:ribosome biogenesis GTPase Der [Thermoanaerobaculia bacterium]
MSFRVAVVGRPNVGKSALFNRLLGRRRSLVHDLPGMTRDVIEEDAELPDGRRFTLVDTGGFDPSDRETIPAAVRRRALDEIARADVVLLVVDASAGVLPGDREAARVVRQAGKDGVVLANKIDRREGREGEGEAYALGFGEVLGVSAEHNLGIDEVFDVIAARMDGAEPADAAVSGSAEIPGAPEPGALVASSPPREIAVAIIGRPNVGKSSLLNALVGFERAIVSEVAGTTRDSLDARLEMDGRAFRIVDTAGIRRKGKTERGPEVLSVVAARKRLDRCDVALVVFDAAEGPTSQDSTVASYAVEKGKGIILVANKWDLAGSGAVAEEFRRDVREKFPFARFAPILLVSAKTGRGVSKLPGDIARVARNRDRRIATAEVNALISRETKNRTSRGESGKPLKILYASQTGTSPPTFSLVASRAENLYFSDARRLENALRKATDFEGTPIEIKV